AGGDVRRDGDGVPAPDEVRGHPAPGNLDLITDDLLDRALLEALAPGRRERIVEVRADGALGLCGGQRVARAALLHKERPTLGGVAALGEPAGAAPGREQGSRAGQDGRAAAP